MQASTISERVRMKSELVLRRRMLPQTAGSASRHTSIKSRQNSDADSMRQSQTNFAVLFRNKFERLVQENKVEQILHTQGHRKSSAFENDFASEVREQSRRVRKQFNELVLKRKNKENQISHMKEQIKLFQDKRKSLTLNLDSFRQVNVSDIQNASELDRKNLYLKNTHEQNIWLLKSYEHVKERTATDLIIFRARSKQLEEYVNYYRQHLAQLKIQQSGLSQTRKNLYSMLDKAKQIVGVESSSKNEMMQTYHAEVREKRSIDRILIERDKKMEEIKQLATSAQQKQQLQKYWELHAVHKVLACVIDSKSHRLIRDYKVEQETYRYMRQHTNLQDINKIIERMENQDKTYQGQLDTIQDLENQIEKAERELREEGKNKISVLQQDCQHIQIEKGQYTGQDREQIGRLKEQKVMKKECLKDMRLLYETLVNWIDKQGTEIGIKMYEGYEVKNLDALVNVLIDRLQKL